MKKSINRSFTPSKRGYKYLENYYVIGRLKKLKIKWVGYMDDYSSIKLYDVIYER